MVLANHDHDDHGAVDTIAGNPITAIHPREMQVGAVTITGIPTKHDEARGSRRGENTVMVLDDAGFRLVHLGDLGHPLNAAEQAAVGRVDVLLIPQPGSFYTIDARVAANVVSALQPCSGAHALPRRSGRLPYRGSRRLPYHSGAGDRSGFSHSGTGYRVSSQGADHLRTPTRAAEQ